MTVGAGIKECLPNQSIQMFIVEANYDGNCRQILIIGLVMTGLKNVPLHISFIPGLQSRVRFEPALAQKRAGSYRLRLLLLYL